MFKKLLLLTLAMITINSCGIFADEKCLTCRLLVCTVCDGAYPELTSGNKCKVPDTLLSNCAIYKNSTKCSVCNSGYYVKGEVCAAIETAMCHEASSDGVCTSCKNAKVLDTVGKKCTETACTAANCANCTVSGTTQTCSKCNSGYMLKDSTCEKVDSGCAVDAMIGCDLCESGYYMKGTDCKKVGGNIQKLGFLAFFFFLLM